MKTITILTLFPSFFDGFLNSSIIKRAISKNAVKFKIINIRDYSLDKNHRVDDRPTGGGAGLIMRLEPLMDCLNKNNLMSTHKILMSPKGHTYTQKDAIRLSKSNDDITIVCGHYEGIDERVLEEIVTDYVSIGDYVLTGGELPAMVLVDAISRMVPGVLKNQESGETESLEGNLLEYPQYSRPEVWREKAVPSILLSGNHQKVDEWRREQSILRTKERRPDLFERAELSEKERKVYGEV